MKSSKGFRFRSLGAGLLSALMLAGAVPVSASETADMPTDAKVQSYQDQLDALREQSRTLMEELKK